MIDIDITDKIVSSRQLDLRTFEHGALWILQHAQQIEYVAHVLLSSYNIDIPDNVMWPAGCCRSPQRLRNIADLVRADKVGPSYGLVQRDVRGRPHFVMIDGHSRAFVRFVLGVPVVCEVDFLT